MKHQHICRTTAVLGLVVIAANAIGLGGCSHPPPSSPTQWTPAQADATPQVSSAATKADEAIGALKSSLMASLKQAMAKGGPVEAIGVCHELAPALAAKISQEQGLKIGRTSFRNRNADNTPPTWAQAAVDRQESSPLVFTSQDGAVAFLRPIHLMPACVQCHGNTEQIAPDVQARLAEQYPQDQATGFAEGELRGYFWVQVPASANP